MLKTEERPELGPYMTIGRPGVVSEDEFDLPLLTTGEEALNLIVALERETTSRSRALLECWDPRSVHVRWEHLVYIALLFHYG
jgi:hypothetical protein